MAQDILKRLVNNSQLAIDDGVYDIADDLNIDKSKHDLHDIILANCHPTLITEIKFASPSLGTIRTLSDPVRIAKQMVAGGAGALSVLTQPYLFHGSPKYFIDVRRAVSDVPMLMKDIIINTVQIDAASKIGADYMLLIQSLFDHGYLDDIDSYIKYGHKKGLGVLLEVHTKKEFDLAYNTDADIIGINNRNLDTLDMDITTTGKILSDVHYTVEKPIISESGIKTSSDIQYLKKCGASAFLIGSSVMGSDDITDTIKELSESY